MESGANIGAKESYEGNGGVEYSQEVQEKLEAKARKAKLIEKHGHEKAQKILEREERDKELEKGHKKYLFSPFMDDEEIKDKVYEDMENLAYQESGTKWMSAGTLLSLDSTQQIIGAGFKAIIDQNKLIIRQNELLLREIKKERKNNELILKELKTLNENIYIE